MGELKFFRWQGAHSVNKLLTVRKVLWSEFFLRGFELNSFLKKGPSGSLFLTMFASKVHAEILFDGFLSL